MTGGVVGYKLRRTWSCMYKLNEMEVYAHKL